MILFYLLLNLQYINKMQTRSQTKARVESSDSDCSANPDSLCSSRRRPPLFHDSSLFLKPIYKVNIDFDDSSVAWRKNKKSMINGYYIYKCSFCNRIPKKGNENCKYHM